jgi:hypothetical protein
MKLVVIKTGGTYAEGTECEKDLVNGIGIGICI